MEDEIKFVCDGCGKNKRIMSVCSKAGDALYCSNLCHNKDYKNHTKICSHKTEIFHFCNYCGNRVDADDLCGAVGCEMAYVCCECLINDMHTEDCGRNCVSLKEVEKLLNNFRSTKINGKDLIAAAVDVSTPGFSRSLVLQLKASNKIIDYTTATLEPSSYENTKFHKFLIMESMREITHLSKYGIQDLGVWKYPLAIKVVDKETNQTLFETKRTLL